jgi:hypothetical protein
MIKFFRHIRRRLLAENRFSRYLIYAIGEIVLVVIGILIALQINNWNEEYKTRLIEKDLYEKLSRDLDKETENNLLNIKWAKIYQDVHYQIYNEIQGAVRMDSLRHYNWLQYIMVFHPIIEVNYESSITEMSNSDVQDLLREYIFYENQTRSAFEEFNEFRMQTMRPFFSEHDIYNTHVVFNNNDRYNFTSLEYTPFINYENLKAQYDNPKLLEHLFSLRFKTSWLIQNLDDLLVKNQNLKTVLAQQLQTK